MRKPCNCAEGCNAAEKCAPTDSDFAGHVVLHLVASHSSRGAQLAWFRLMTTGTGLESRRILSRQEAGRFGGLLSLHTLWLVFSL